MRRKSKTAGEVEHHIQFFVEGRASFEFSTILLKRILEI